MDDLLVIAKAYNVPTAATSTGIDPIPILIKIREEADKGIKISFFTQEKRERLIYDAISAEWNTCPYLQTDKHGNDNFRIIPCDDPISKKGKPIFAAEAFKIRALAVQTFYAIKNGLERKGKIPIEITITCGFTDEKKGTPLAVSEVTAEISQPDTEGAMAL